jgi:hypothetical protein
MGIVKASNLDLSKVTFSDVKTDNHGRKMVFLNYNNGKLLVQTPKMYAPNGVRRWRKKDAIDNKEDKFEMELSFYGENGTDKNSQEIRDFKSKWEEFDDMVKSKVVEKAKEWLGMPKLDMNTLESVMYTPMVRVAKDKEGNELPYPSRVRAKIDREMDSNGDFTGRFLSNKKFKTDVLIFDENKEQVEFNENNAEVTIPKGCQVISVLELVYLSLSKTTISTKWKLVQAKVFRNRDTITGYAMLDDDEDLENDLDTDELQMENLKINDDVVVVEGQSSENEEEQQELDEVVEQEEEEEQPKQAKRGRAKRV